MSTEAENLIIQNGIAWRVKPDGKLESATPGECAREIERLAQDNTKWAQRERQWLDEANLQTAEAERFRSALKTYGSHTEDCRGLDSMDYKCTCGWFELIATL